MDTKNTTKTRLLKEDNKDSNKTDNNDGESIDNKSSSDQVNSLCTKLFPTGFKKELKGLFYLGWPASVALFFSSSIGTVSLMFCGQLGTDELDGAGLGLSLINITGLAAAYGVTAACDTLFSQAFGGKKKRLYDIYLQRSLILLTLVVLVCWCVHLNIEGLMILLGQNRSVARNAGIYVLYYMPGLWLLTMVQVVARYLQNQNKVFPMTFISIIGNVANILFQFIGVNVLHAGLIGSALGQVGAFFLMLLISVVYLFWSGALEEWEGWSIQALENWGEFLKLGLAGYVMLAFEWWTIEAGVILSGLLSEEALGTNSVLSHVSEVLYTIPYGVSIACQIRTGQCLGANDVKGTITTTRVAQIFAVFVFIFPGAGLLILRNKLPLLYTQDAVVVHMVSSIIPVIVLMNFFDCIVATSMGTLRGCGRQSSGAVCNIIGYIVLAFPLAMVFMFVLKMGPVGLWWGVISGLSAITCLYLYFILFRIDWEKEVTKAQERISEESNETEELESQALVAGETRNGYGCKQKPRDINNGKSKIKSSNNINSANSRIQLFMKRFLGCFGVISMLIVSLCIRLFVPLPSEAIVSLVPSSWNSTETSLGT